MTYQPNPNFDKKSGGAVAMQDQGRFARNAKMILLLCAIVFVIGSIFVDDENSHPSSAMKLALKLVGFLLHML